MMYNVVMAILETFLLFGIGALALKLKMIEAQDINKLSRLALDLFMPLLTFSVITRSFSMDKLNEFWLMPVLGFFMMFIGGIAGFFLKHFIHYDTKERIATFHHICAINNYVFLPLIVINSIFGERHVALLLVMNVGSTIGFWTIGIVTLTGIHKNSILRSLKNIISINVIAVFIALLFAVSDLYIPKVIASVTRTLGDMAVPFTIILTGAALYNGARAIVKYKRDVVYLSIVRLLILPLCLIFLLKLLPLPRDVYETCFIVALMPAAVSSVLVARLNGGSDEFAAQAIIVTTLLSLGTIPLLMFLI